MENPTLINEDNSGAICWATEGCKRSKHVTVRENFILECVYNGAITVQYCKTSEQLAYIMTKALSASRHLHLRDSLGVKHINL